MTGKMAVFDFADTLATLSPNKESVVKSFIFESAGINIDEDKVAQTYHYVNNALFYSSVKVASSSDRADFYHNFNRCLLNLLGVSHLVDANMLYGYFRANKQHWVLKKDAKHVLETLKSRKHKVCLVSNFDSVLDDLLERLEIKDLFDSIFISQVCGIEKPNPNFLGLPLKKHNIAASDTYFIGDSYHLDFYPAMKLGLNAILLDERKNYYNIEQLKRIDSIIDTLSFF